MKVLDPLISRENGIGLHLTLYNTDSLHLCMGNQLFNIPRIDSVDDVENVTSIRLNLFPVTLREIYSCSFITTYHLKHISNAEFIPKGNVDVGDFGNLKSFLSISEEQLEMVFVNLILRRKIVLKLKKNDGQKVYEINLPIV